MDHVSTMPPDPAGAEMHILTPTGTAIRGILEAIPACSKIENLYVEVDGSIGFDSDGWAEQWYEDARPVEQPHPDTGRRGFVFVDFDGGEHHEDDVLRCLPGARLPGCPYCGDAATPVADKQAGMIP